MENRIEEVYTAYGSSELRKREEELDKLAVEIFSNYRDYEQVVPRFPYCIVRILPKDVTIGGIYVPDVARTNKPVYEGIVLRVWEPRHIFDHKGQQRVLYSDLEVGDHVLFPHYAGQPLPGLNEGKYRAIPEGITRNGGNVFGSEVGVIFAKLDYTRPRVEDVFVQLLEDKFQLTTTSIDCRDIPLLLQSIRQEFDISVKIKGSMTKSGA